MDLTGKTLHRTVTIARAGQRAAGGGVPVSISSDLEVERGFGVEVLDHRAGAVRLERAAAGLPLLWGHDHDTLIGRLENVRVSGGRIRGEMRFGASQRAQELAADVEAGIARDMSVGYRIHDWTEGRAADGLPLITVTDWEPFEASLVSVPADAAVGVGRTFEEPTMFEDDDITPEGETATRAQRRAARRHEQEAARAEREADRRAETDEQIRGLAESFGLHDLADQHIALGSSFRDFQAVARAAVQNRLEPVPTGHTAPQRFTDYSGRVESPTNVSEHRVRSFPGATHADRCGAAFASGQFVRALMGNPQAQRWLTDRYGSRALATTALSKGGATVPEEMSQAIIRLVEEYGVARRLAQVAPMSSDTMAVPRRTGGVTAYFIGENEQLTESEPTFDNVNLVARKLATLTRISSELAEDSVIDVGSMVAEEAALSFAEKEDSCFIDGDGTSTYGGIVGLRPKLIDGNHTAGAVDAAAGHDTFAEIDADDLLTVMGALPEYARARAQWLCSPRAKALVFDALAAAAGGATMIETANSRIASYLGYPIVVSPKMPNGTGDLSNEVMILFGDFSRAVTIGDRRMVRLLMLMERYADYDQIGVQATERFDINVHDLGDTSDAGPVVGLVGE